MSQTNGKSKRTITELLALIEMKVTATCRSTSSCESLLTELEHAHAPKPLLAAAGGTDR